MLRLRMTIRFIELDPQPSIHAFGELPQRHLGAFCFCE
jgi:hypothetical protein